MALDSCASLTEDGVSHTCIRLTRIGLLPVLSIGTAKYITAQHKLLAYLIAASFCYTEAHTACTFSTKPQPSYVCKEAAWIGLLEVLPFDTETWEYPRKTAEKCFTSATQLLDRGIQQKKSCYRKSGIHSRVQA